MKNIYLGKQDDATETMIKDAIEKDVSKFMREHAVLLGVGGSVFVVMPISIATSYGIAKMFGIELGIFGSMFWGSMLSILFSTLELIASPLHRLLKIGSSGFFRRRAIADLDIARPFELNVAEYREAQAKAALQLEIDAMAQHFELKKQRESRINNAASILIMAAESKKRDL